MRTPLRRTALCVLVSSSFVACSHRGLDETAVDASTSESSSALAPQASPAQVAVPMPKANAGGMVLRRLGDASPEHPALAAARKMLASDPASKKLLDERTHGLSLEADGFVTDAWRAPKPDLVGSILPHRANDVWRVSPGRAERWSMALSPKGANDVAGVLDAGRVVYPDALPHADVIAVGRAREVEQLVLLKDEGAPKELRWRIQLGSDLRAHRLATGAIDFLDGKGEPALRVQRPFAIDATGKHVDADVALEKAGEGDELVVRLDPTGLTYPVLLDPVVEVPIWVNVTPATPTIPAAVGVLLAYQSGSTPGTLLIGGTTATSGTIFGSCPGSYNSTVYNWNGSTWSTFAAPSALATRWAAAGGSYGTGAIVFGGQNCTSGSALLSDTWTLSGTTWTQVCSSCAPPAEMWAQMAYLPGTGAVLFSGLDSTAAAYVYNGGANWTKVAYGAADTANGMVVPERERAAMSADPVSNRVYIVGGFNVPTSTTAVPWADAWAYNPTATGASYGNFHWTPLCGVGAMVGCPFAPRASAGFVYDSGRKKHILFGGETNKSFPSGYTGFQDTWEYDSATNTWSELCSTCSPVRWMAPFAYDSARGRLITAASFDYSAGSNQNQTWELHVRGGSCSADTDCDTGHCVEGTCCETVCGVCQTCVAATSPGVCSNVAAGVSDPLGRCASGGQCNGAGACGLAAGSACSTGSQCATGYCVNSTCCTTSACGVGLTCADATGTCKKVLGQACLTPSECASGSCVDGTCCSSASCASGSHCSYASAGGNCAKDNGQTCTAGSQCGSGNCVDGYCCNSSCTGQCQACDVSGSAGTCITVSGPPHTASGLRAACAGSGSCGAQCSGTNATACTYPGSTTACGAQACATGLQTNLGQCNGSGSCAQTTTPCGNYACGATSCKTSCTVDGDCASTSYYCNGGSCQLKLSNGSTCSTNPSCQSGNCVSGICCNTACTGAGYSCHLASAPGTCTKAPGTACAAGSECGSGFCVDGVCCDSACNGQCQACDVGGHVGTCYAVTGTPHGTRPTCSGTGVGTTCGPTCDGKTVTSCTYPTPTTTCGAATCTDGPSLSTYSQVGACNGSGSCTAGSGDCGTYKCSGTACGASCTAKSQCSAGNYCDTAHGVCVPIVGLGNSCTDPTACPSGFCVDGVCCEAACGAGYSCNASTTTKGHCRKLQGVACGSNSECGSGNCVDGYCCNSSCTGSCEACNVSGKEGTCTPIVGQPKTGHPACSATPTDPVCGLACNGTDNVACHYATVASSCGVATCAGGIEGDVSTCDGSGGCKTSTKSCGAYGCGPTACLTTCAADTDCASGFFCKTGTCTGVQALGESCAGDSQCKSGHCTDGVCCGVASCGAGAACAGPGASAGTCLKGNASTCMASTECASGHCVDGLCCDKACDGQCEACDVKGSEGSCTPVTGPPHGMRSACDSLMANDCAKATCDGAARDKCGGFANGATTACGADACTMDKKLQKHGQCDGKGSCSKPDAISCVEYACDTTANACKSSCTSDADCADSFKCDTASSKCVQGSTCSADRTQSISKSGDAITCAPYLCGSDGTCLKECATSEDCAAGACDTTVHACVVTNTNQPDNSGSGCAVSGEQRPGNARIGALIALAAVAWIARRRRAA